MGIPCAAHVMAGTSAISAPSDLSALDHGHHATHSCTWSVHTSCRGCVPTTPNSGREGRTDGRLHRGTRGGCHDPHVRRGSEASPLSDRPLEEMRQGVAVDHATLNSARVLRWYTKTPGR